ncbi:MAG: hypothetical protein SNJ71_00205 [Bacteroidales bacterium]
MAVNNTNNFTKAIIKNNDQLLIDPNTLYSNVNPNIINAPSLKGNGINTYTSLPSNTINSVQPFVLLAEFKLNDNVDQSIFNYNNARNALAVRYQKLSWSIIDNTETKRYIYITPNITTFNTIYRVIVLEGVSTNIEGNKKRKIWINSTSPSVIDFDTIINNSTHGNTSIIYRSLADVNNNIFYSTANIFQIGFGNHIITQEEVENFINYGVMPINNNMHIYSFTENRETIVYDRNRTNPKNMTLTNSNDSNWQISEFSICRSHRNGCDIWRHNTDNRYMYIPLAFNGNSILGQGNTLANHTWVRKIPSNRNNYLYKETGCSIKYPITPQLQKADKNNFLYDINTGIPRILTYNDILNSSPSYLHKKIEQNNVISDIKIVNIPSKLPRYRRNPNHTFISVKDKFITYNDSDNTVIESISSQTNDVILRRNPNYITKLDYKENSISTSNSMDALVSDPYDFNMSHIYSIEFWAKKTITQDMFENHVITMMDNNGNNATIKFNSVDKTVIFTGPAYLSSPPNVVKDGVWMHYRFYLFLNAIYIFVNGVLVAFTSYGFVIGLKQYNRLYIAKHNINDNIELSCIDIRATAPYKDTNGFVIGKQLFIPQHRFSDITPKFWD